MKDTVKLNLSWLLLMGLTLGGMLMGEYAQPGFWITVSIAAITAVKGRLIIDRFMELQQASPVIRNIMKAFGLLVPGLMILTYLLEAELARVIPPNNKLLAPEVDHKQGKKQDLTHIRDKGVTACECKTQDLTL